MKDIVLFNTKQGTLTQQDFYDALVSLHAMDCEYLFIHSTVNFGLPNPELTKKELLSALLDAVLALNVKNVLVPTYTFSFCNKENFDVQSTKSSMGMFSEFFRKHPLARRSVDPMMSVAMIGSDFSVIDDIGNVSCGENSTFDLLHKKGKTKFLFLGNAMSDCMTFTHYVEVMKNVPYRYAKKFSGIVVDNGIAAEKEYILHVRYHNIFPFTDTRIDELVLKNNAGKTMSFGDSVINIADEAKVYSLLSNAIDKNPDFMLSHSCPQVFDDLYMYEKKVAL